jgi:hypothetical protein
MTYRGTVKNGVIVIHDAPFLPEGTSVRVEVDEPARARGTAAALLAADVRWEGNPAEVDMLLGEVQQMRAEDLRVELARPETGDPLR